MDFFYILVESFACFVQWLFVKILVTSGQGLTITWAHKREEHILKLTSIIRDVTTVVTNSTRTCLRATSFPLSFYPNRAIICNTMCGMFLLAKSFRAFLCSFSSRYWREFSEVRKTCYNFEEKRLRFVATRKRTNIVRALEKADAKKMRVIFLISLSSNISVDLSNGRSQLLLCPQITLRFLH